MNAIVAENIHKSFGNITALDGISLTAKKGDIYGLVGPDGAGKTTLMRILVGIMSADNGNANVMGNDVLSDPESVKHSIGYMSQKFSLYGDLSVGENLEFYADLFEIKGKEKEDRTKRLLEFSRLEPFLDRRADALSGGMKQKLGLSCALIHTPELLVLDEPTTGVDPVSRRDLWGILYDLWKEGMTIFVSTPYLDEAERCTKIGFIYRGRIIQEASPEELKNNADFSILRVTFKDIQDARYKLESNSHYRSYNLFGNHAHFITTDFKKDSAALKKQFKQDGLSILEIAEIKPTLEDVFLHLTSSTGAKNE